MWCIPPHQSAEFVYHMEDVLEVYTRPPDPGRPVVCVDETCRQLIGEVRPALPPGGGRATARYDCEYERRGTASVFVAFEPLGGWRHAAACGRRTAADFAHFVRDLAGAGGRYAGADKVVLVMDQLNTHTPASLYAAFPPDEARRLAERLEVHRTPKHGSWLNMAEVELSVLARDLPPRIPDAEALAAHLAAWETRRNASGAKANWQFTTADARVKLRTLYPTVDG
jgi:hypothetical protein